VTRTVSAGTATYESAASGANVDHDDIAADLVAGLDVVVDTGSAGTEAGNLTDLAVSATVDNVASTSLTLRTGTGAGLVGTVTFGSWSLTGAGSALVVDADNDVRFRGVGDSAVPLATVTVTSANGEIVQTQGSILATTVTMTAAADIEFSDLGRPDAPAGSATLTSTGGRVFAHDVFATSLNMTAATFINAFDLGSAAVPGDSVTLTATDPVGEVFVGHIFAATVDLTAVRFIRTFGIGSAQAPADTVTMTATGGGIVTTTQFDDRIFAATVVLTAATWIDAGGLGSPAVPVQSATLAAADEVFVGDVFATTVSATAGTFIRAFDIGSEAAPVGSLAMTATGDSIRAERVFAATATAMAGTFINALDLGSPAARIGSLTMAATGGGITAARVFATTVQMTVAEGADLDVDGIGSADAPGDSVTLAATADGGRVIARNVFASAVSMTAGSVVNVGFLGSADVAGDTVTLAATGPDGQIIGGEVFAATVTMTATASVRTFSLGSEDAPIGALALTATAGEVFATSVPSDQIFAATVHLSAGTSIDASRIFAGTLDMTAGTSITTGLLGTPDAPVGTLALTASASYAQVTDFVFAAAVNVTAAYLRLFELHASDSLTLTATGGSVIGSEISAPTAVVTADASIDLSLDVDALTTSSNGNQTLAADGSVAVGAGGLVARGGSRITLQGGPFLTAPGHDVRAGSVRSDAALGGTGIVHGTDSIVLSDAVAPGSSPGILNLTGPFVLFDLGSRLDVEVNGSTPGTGHAQVNATGVVALTGATLNAFGTIGSGPGQQIVLIANDGTDAVIGTFAGLPAGATVTIDGVNFAIRYDGGTGNDVVLTEAGPPPPPGVAQHAAVGGSLDGTARRLVPSGGKFGLGDSLSFFPGVAVNVRVATADVTGDGVADYVGGTGAGAITRVSVIDGVTGKEVLSWQPFEAAFTGGVYVAAADIDGDGKAEVVVAPDRGGGPVVAVYSGAKLAAGRTSDAAQLVRFLGIGDPDFRGGARPALGDVNGDKTPDLVVAAGFGGGPRIAVFDGMTLAPGSPTPLRLVPDFFAFEDGLRDGAFVAAGNVDGDEFADLAFGGGPGGAPRARVISGKGWLAAGGFAGLDAIPAAQLANFFAGDANSRGGVRLALGDANGDGRADLVTGSGEGEPSRVRVFQSATLLAGSADPDQELDPFGATLANGVFVG
jgi:hypothetical protein